MRVLVVYDHVLVAQAVGGLLSELCDLELQAVCSSAGQALSALELATPDLLIQDVLLPGETWEPVVQDFLRRNNKGSVLFLTALATSFVPPSWLGSALLGVLDKSRAWVDLIALVSQCQRQASAGRSGTASAGMASLERLSPREQRVLHLLGQGLSNRELALALGLSLGTVESYRKSICSKLGISGAELVRLAVLRRCLPLHGDRAAEA